MTQFVL